MSAVKPVAKFKYTKAVRDLGTSGVLTEEQSEKLLAVATEEVGKELRTVLAAAGPDEQAAALAAAIERLMGWKLAQAEPEKAGGLDTKGGAVEDPEEAAGDIARKQNNLAPDDPRRRTAKD